MKRQDFLWIGALLAFAAFVWWRDTRWLASADDTLPILLGLPLFLWLRAPWKLLPAPRAAAARPLLFGALLFPLGVALDSNFVLAASWTALLWSWISVRFEDANPVATRRLLVLPLISFPWIATDLERLGWWFRLSGAASAERLLGWGGCEVAREGTFVVANGFAVSVEAACSGMNGLQSMLVAGSMIAFMTLRHSRLFWLSLPVLVAAAWLANLSRIMAGALIGVWMEPEAAARWVGPLHVAAGWAALCLLFVACWFLFSALARLETPTWRTLRRRAAALPWLEFVLVGYCAWRARELFVSWRYNPLDSFAWLAFAVWLVPLLWPGRGLKRGRLRTPWLAGAGLGMVFLGDAGDLNVARHLGLALVLTSFASPRGRWLWSVAAIAWFPALGWFGSRVGLEVNTLALMRVGLAAAASAWVWWARPTVSPAETLEYAGTRRVTS